MLWHIYWHPCYEQYTLLLMPVDGEKCLVPALFLCLFLFVVLESQHFSFFHMSTWIMDYIWMPCLSAIKEHISWLCDAISSSFLCYSCIHWDLRIAKLMLRSGSICVKWFLVVHWSFGKIHPVVNHQLSGDQFHEWPC